MSATPGRRCGHGLSATLAALVGLLLIGAACTFPIEVQVTSAVPRTTGGPAGRTLASAAPVRAPVDHPTPAPGLIAVNAPIAHPTLQPAKTTAPATGPAAPSVSAGSTRPAGTARPPAASPPTRIVAPSIGLDAAIVESGWRADPRTGRSEWQIPDNAAGFLADSAMPGQRGNLVIAGHHNVRGKVFAHLAELKPGDGIHLYVGDQAYDYRVEDVFILPERGVSEEQQRQNALWIAPTKDERLTLVSCWPANDNSHRVIVVAYPIEAAERSA